MVHVLGIETSCDETGIAIYSGEQGLLANELYSQVNLHAPYGGVVPELASRDHIRKLIPLTQRALIQAKLTLKDIDAIAYTAGPGLIGALLVGAAFARSLAWTLDIPSIAIHHMEAHLLAPLLEKNVPQFPFIALLVSGGHTLLILVEAMGQYQLLGDTLDDAVGEAFDKTAKLLGLPYPGGPALAALAEKGNSKRFSFPRPMVDRPGLDFSFSGLKTFALNTLRANLLDDQLRADIACAFQDAVVDVLVIKCKRAFKQTKLNRLVVAGGVGANKELRSRLTQEVKAMSGEVFFPRPEFCTDNGAMIALTGFLRFQAKQYDQDLRIKVNPRWSIEELPFIES